MLAPIQSIVRPVSSVIPATGALAAKRTFFAPSEVYNKKQVIITKKTGLDIINDPKLNKGSAFTADEKDRLGIRGLVPPRPQTLEAQYKRCKTNLDKISDPLEKFIYLNHLQNRNETLYYKMILENFVELAPIIYTPVVGEACQKFHKIFTQTRGMYFSTADRGQMSAIANNWPYDDVDVIVVTDGSRILGLGDLGAGGMQIPIGKLTLYVCGGGINPRNVLPIVLDVGTNNKELLNDPLYLGMQHPRLQGEEFHAFVDEWVSAITDRFPKAVIQFEDFMMPNALDLLLKYKDQICMFNDDIQSTGAITLASVLATMRARGGTFADIKKETFLCLGAGSSGVGVCETIVDCIVAEGATREEAYAQFYMFDHKGLLGKGRDDLLPSQQVFMRKEYQGGKTPAEMLEKIKPTCLLGLSTCPKLFTKEMLSFVSSYCEKPGIFPLSNPTSRSECTAEEAVEYTNGNLIFASGSPFDPVEWKGKTIQTNQCNNSYSFPGIGLGLVSARSTRVPFETFQVCARVIASIATPEMLATGKIFPDLDNLRAVSLEVGVEVAKMAERMNIATQFPPKGMEWREWLKHNMWQPEYPHIVVKNL